MAGWHRSDHVAAKIPDEPGPSAHSRHARHALRRPPARPWPQYLPLRCHRTMKIETPAAASAKKMGCSWSANAKTDRLIRLGTGNTTARTPVGHRLFTAPSTIGYSSAADVSAHSGGGSIGGWHRRRAEQTQYPTGGMAGSALTSEDLRKAPYRTAKVPVA